MINTRVTTCHPLTQSSKITKGDIQSIPTYLLATPAKRKVARYIVKNLQ